MKIPHLEENIKEAIKYFWATREKQTSAQKISGKLDAGNRSAVTGGKQMEGFEELARNIAKSAGVPEGSIFKSKAVTLPGFFRPTKDWDFLIVHNGRFVSAIEFKSQVGPSFGNNFNNRLEEAIGTSTDLWTAYREGAFKSSPRPWIGYLFVLEDCERSRRPVSVLSPHFEVFPEFKEASYGKRYEILLQKLLRERLYDGCSLIKTSQKPFGINESIEELNARRFFLQFKAHVEAFMSEEKAN